MDNDREALLHQWDSWRAYIRNQGEGSWPRDAYEAVLDAYEEETARLRASEAALRAENEGLRNAIALATPYAQGVAKELFAHAEITRLRSALQALSDAADEMNGKLDEQTYDDVRRGDWDLPDDYEHHAVLTALDIRKLSEAICSAQQILREVKS